ncbi:hypothetical protein N657DRAFT_632456 [Parathielavia appendiculata]|uniref:FAR1 domain-containing protein n=1 Tax=Parathielavia appendiculata TaxID=2587402 RepID=A0AAN6U5I4_9PEZI|nr:hypothetical protein N657DRAFT_632456 [Parathielavia appendiculata]
MGKFGIHDHCAKDLAHDFRRMILELAEELAFHNPARVFELLAGLCSLASSNGLHGERHGPDEVSANVTAVHMDNAAVDGVSRPSLRRNTARRNVVPAYSHDCAAIGDNGVTQRDKDNKPMAQQGYQYTLQGLAPPQQAQPQMHQQLQHQQQQRHQQQMHQQMQTSQVEYQQPQQQSSQQPPQQHQQHQQQQQQQQQGQQQQSQHQQGQQHGRPQMALLPPPQDRLYNTWNDLREDVKAFCKSQGYAVVIISSLNRDAEGNYRRYNMCCAKGGKNYTSHSKGLRQTQSTKTGCPMRLKAIREKAWPYNDKWHVIVQCAEHNHEPFTGGPNANAPSQFRKIEADGMRWLMIMHREAQCDLRQLTIGIRISFGDKYQYVKKTDVRNCLAKIKREEDRKAAAAAAAAAMPANQPYTIIPASHLPPPPPPVQVEKMPQLPPELQVPDPDMESDDDDDQEDEEQL